MAVYLGSQVLERRDGSHVDSVFLKNKMVGFLFSAGWCPPCRRFTPQVKKFYASLGDDCHDFEIVFVSSDRCEADAREYFRDEHGDWLAVPFATQHIKDLPRRFQVAGVPSLIVVNAKGYVLSRIGRADIAAGKPAKAVVEEWRRATPKKIDDFR